MQGRDVQIVQCVRAHGGVAPQELADQLGVSTRTLRTYIHRINSELRGAARIELRRGAGYALAVDDGARLEALLAPVHGIDFSSTTPKERATYLLHVLLERPDWVTLEELGRIFYLSRATISSDLKLVREELAPFGLELETRPHHGVRVVGSEMGRRACLAAHAVGLHQPSECQHGRDVQALRLHLRGPRRRGQGHARAQPQIVPTSQKVSVPF